jgi:hypothetical protein
MNALGRSTRGIAATALLFVALLAGSVAGAAAADPPKTLWTGCTGSLGGSVGAGNCQIPRGIAADPETGRLYVADQANQRINELTAWGEFVRAWGWGVRDGSPELQTCTQATGCQAGSVGSGAGQFSSPQGVAIDSAGHLYVVDKKNHRVQKFDPTGAGGEVEFLLAFGGPGTGDGQFGTLEVGSYIDIGPGNQVYVGDQGRVQVFDSGGNYLKSIPLPGETVQSLAVDPTSGDFYVTYYVSAQVLAYESKEGVRKFSPTGEALCTAAVEIPRALALDANGDLYVAEADPVLPHGIEEYTEIRKFDSGCEEYPNYGFLVGQPSTEQGVAKGIKTTGIAANTVTSGGGVALYYGNSPNSYSYVRAYYPIPDRPAPFDQPTLRAPTILSQYALSVDSDGATVRAEINPHFWGNTSYYVEYGTAPCSLGGCKAQPLAPGTQLGAGVIDEGATTNAVFLHGLQPATTYHYRFAAQSSGGGPVFAPDASFTTFPEPGDPRACPNDAVRIGAAAKLPNCRGYEMVSPIDKNGGDIEALESAPRASYNKFFQSRLNQAAPSGERITYSAARAFAGAISSPWSSQYIAERDPAAGWSTRSLNPPLGENIHGQANQEIQFRAFSEDLCSAWLMGDTDLALVPGAPAGVPNLYRRQNCGEQGFELMTTAYPPGYSHAAEPEGSEYFPRIQGFSADQRHSFFRANAALTPDAPAGKTFQLYESSPDGGLHLVSLLPNGEASPTHASLGTAFNERVDFRRDSVAGAVKGDGSRAIWTAVTGGGGNGFNDQPGTVYLRANPTAEPSASGGCDEAGKACTLQLSEPSSRFIAADPALSRVIYQTGGNLFEAEIAEEGEALVANSTPIAAGVRGVMGASDDTTCVYFVSTQALAPGASAGESNLYLHEQGSPLKLVATLADGDSNATNTEDSLDNVMPAFRTARVSPDGMHAAFMSQRSLTGYDNTDANSGEPAFEIFLYDAGAGGLVCISCNPSGRRPHGRLLGKLFIGREVWAAAQLPGWAYQLHPSRLLAEDGSHLFFESYDALVLSDTNGARDVYEWERASSQGECDAIGATLYVQSAGGCLSLISSGESPQDSEFIDASVDGRDVFFTTNESLFSEDPGLIDIYDAREGGGFAPRIQPPSCQGEACQPPATPPNDPTPASSAFQGPGNVREGVPRKPRCGKAKVRRKGRCVAKKPRKRAGKHSNNKRAGKPNKTGRAHR